ncbi:hypothetical protein [Streptomyces sp. NPDC005533]|uniref:hypothetical protein n=1 Tax=Streptomyces sp. NPDC005533 TaxID=3364723 RepID=UPI0036BED7CA
MSRGQHRIRADPAVLEASTDARGRAPETVVLASAPPTACWSAYRPWPSRTAGGGGGIHRITRQLRTRREDLPAELTRSPYSCTTGAPMVRIAARRPEGAEDGPTVRTRPAGTGQRQSAESRDRP